MKLSTLFDMASVTKVLAATNAVAQFYERGELDLDQRIHTIPGFSDFAQNGKSEITVRHLLLHNSGLPAGPSPVYYHTSFGCPESLKPYPELSFSCQRRIFDSVMAQRMVNPVGQVYIYSDLSMIVLMYVVGHYAQTLGYVKHEDVGHGCPTGNPRGSQMCFFEAYVRKHILDRLDMHNSMYVPPSSLKNQIAPAWIDRSYHKELIHGYVSDGNTYALGGISGHAGLFSNALDVQKILHAIMFPESVKLPILNSTTVEMFSTAKNTTQSERALGWDTNAWGEGTCSTLSRKTFLHLGYTGTQVCLDPERKLYTTLLTNRVYPSTENQKISVSRRVFNKAVQQIYDSYYRLKRS